MGVAEHVGAESGAQVPPPETAEDDDMNRAILLFVAASMTMTGCYTRPCNVSDITFYWHFPSGSTELSCNDAGVVSVQISVDGQVQGQFPCTALASDGVTPVQGVTLLSFSSRPYDFQLDGLDKDGHAVWSDAFSYTPAGCGNIALDRDLTALTGDLDVSATFTDDVPPPTDPVQFTTCAGAGVENFFIELVDGSGNPVSGADGVYVPCVDSAGVLPGFVIPSLEFGSTYAFRTLAATTFDGSVPVSNQRVVYQRCGASFTFTGAYQIDLRTSAASATCP
jgi:hypothetical protein